MSDKTSAARTEPVAGPAKPAPAAPGPVGNSPAAPAPAVVKPAPPPAESKPAAPVTPKPPAPKPAAETSPPKPAAPRPAAPAPKPAETKPVAPAAAKPPAAPAAPPPADSKPAPVRPPIAAAAVQMRHRGMVISFLLVVLLPVMLAAGYLWTFAADQYASQVGFTVRQEEGAGASGLLGGLAQFTGTTGARDSDILYEFIRSQQIVENIDRRIDLPAVYGRSWPGDPVFAYNPEGRIEDLLRYWQRMVRVSYDAASGLIELRVLAFSADEAQLVAREIVTESQEMINALNASARDDVMRHAVTDLEIALVRLKGAREALTGFRTRTRVVDPASDIQSQSGVLASLQQQLAQALIEHDMLRETTNTADPRLAQARRRIEVIRTRINEERSNLVVPGGIEGDVAGDYPSLIAEFESLTVDREFAEETYRAALTALDLARAKASRQSRYLAAYVTPTLPQTAEYPQRLVLTALLAFFLTLAWATGALVYYSIRDRR